MSRQDDDLSLVEHARQGDKRAFERLVEKYHRRLLRLLARVMRNQEDVEDVAQETFIKAYRALPSFRGDAAFYTWLYRIGINTAKNRLASRGKNPPAVSERKFDEDDEHGERFAVEDIHTPESVLFSKQLAYAVNEAVAALSEELRTAITLREIEGLSYEEIATAMNCPVGTVRSRIFRAREAIAAKLRPILDTPEGKRW